MLVVTGLVDSEERAAELSDALDVLGPNVKSHTMFAGSYMWLDDVPTHSMISAMEEIIRDWEPDWVVIPDPRGFHQEHRFISKAALAAMRPNGGTGWHRPPVVAIYEEPFDSWTLGTDRFYPTLHVSLTADQLDRKCEAMLAHVSQVRPSPSERSPRTLRGMAMLRGGQAGVEFAEAYEVRRWLV